MKTLKSLIAKKITSTVMGEAILLSKSFWIRFLLFSVSIVFLGASQKIYAASSGVTYTGKILDANDVPVTASSVIFTITVYDPSGKCWLYSEQRNLDLSQTAGTFAFEIGSDDSTTLYGAAPVFNNSASGGPKNLADLFNNKKSFTGLGSVNGCTGTYDPSTSTDPNEGRLLSVFFRVGASGADQAIPPMRITPVPLAMQALAVNGYGTGELLRVDQATVTTSGINNNPLSASQYTEFWSLVNKSSSSYLPVAGDVGIVGGNNKINNLLGQALPTGPATNGQVLVSNGTSWTLQSMGGGGGSVASVSGTSPISVGGTATAPVISLPAAGTSFDGYLTSADWNTFNSKQSSSLSSGNLFVGNASGVATGVSLSGDATINNTGVLTLKNTGTAGTYGSGSLVPIITTDAQGRVTGVTTSAPLDVTKLPLSGGTMTGAIDMGSQDITNTGNISMAASKTLGLSSNASDPATPAAGQVWYNSTSNVIKYYDGSSVKSLGTSGGASQWATTGANIYYNTGNVGVGITNPSYILEVGGTAAFRGNTHAIMLQDGSGWSIGTIDVNGTDIGILNGNPAGKIFLNTNSNSTGNGNQVVIDNSGNVGIGTAAPSSKLDVYGNAHLRAGLWLDSTGYVGGATQYAGRLNVADNGTAWNQLMAISQDDEATDALSIMNLTYTSSAGSGLILKQNNSGLARIKNAGAADPAGFSLDTTGNVGIGTTAPGSSLDVKGTLRLSGSTSGYVGFAPAAAAGSTTYTLPSTQGTAGQVLSTDGVAGNATLSWVTPSASLPGLTSSQVWVGNASGVATAVSLSGDISSVSNTGSVTIDKTQTAVANKILQLDANSVAVTKGEDIGGAGTGKVSLRYPSSATNTTLTFPSSAGSANQFLQTDGSGNLNWATPSPILPGLASTQVWVGDASGNATAVSLSGDISSVSNAGAVTVNKTTTGQANKLLSLDGTGVATSMGNQLNGATGSVTLQAAGTTTTYSLTLPVAQGTAGQTLSNNGSGVLSWVTPSSSQWNTTGTDIYYNTGKVGIGLTNPNYSLDISGDFNVTNAGSPGLTFSNSNSDAQLSVSSYSSKPTGRFLVQGSTTNSMETALLLDGNALGGSPSVGNGVAATFRAYTGGFFREQAKIGSVWTATADNNHSADLLFSTVQNGNGAASPTEKMRITSAGNVGIGTTAPGATLDVVGVPGQEIARFENYGMVKASIDQWGGLNAYGASISGYGYGARLNVGNNGSSANHEVVAIAQDSETVKALSIINETYTPTDTNGFRLWQSNAGVGRIGNAGAADPAGISIATNGNIGIGTASPTAKLHLTAGAASANSAPLKFTSGTLLTTPEDGTIEYDGTSFYYTTGGVRNTIGSGSSSVFNGITDINNASGNINLTPSSGNSVIVNQSTASTSSSTGALVVSGGAGIGGSLNVAGAITGNNTISAVSGSTATSGANQSSPSISLKANYWTGAASAVDTWSLTNVLGSGSNPTSTLTIDHPSGSTGAKRIVFPTGNVGIGTTTPSYPLEVMGDVKISNFKSLFLDSGSGVFMGGGGIWGNSSPDWLRLGTSYSFPAMSIDSSNNVGIGTTTPGASLDVKGAIRLSGATSGYAGFQPASNAGSTVWTLPAADGSNGQVLTTNGGGILSWSTPSGGSVTLSGDVSGTSSTTTVDKIKGTAVSATAPTAAGQVLRYDGTSSFVPNFLSLADIRSTVTPANTIFPNSTCTADKSLTWSALTDTFTCQSIGIADSQITYGSKTANTFLAAPSGATGAPTFRTIVAADLPAGGYDSNYFKNGGNSFGADAAIGTNDAFKLNFKTNNATRLTVDTTGKVGVGTTNPGSLLEVSTPSVSSSIASFSHGAYPIVDVGSDGGGHGYENLRDYLGTITVRISGQEGSAPGITSLSIFPTISSAGVSDNYTGISISPTIAQTGSAGYTGLLINPTETSTGAGPNNLILAQINGVTKFSASNTGQGYFAGKVGIGTTNPGSALEIVTNQLESFHVLDSSNATNPYYFYAAANRSGAGIVDIGGYQEGVGSAPLVLNRMGGNVGIHTISPAHSLDVGDGTTIVDAGLNSSGDAWYYMTKAGTDQFAMGYRNSTDSFNISSWTGFFTDRLTVQRTTGNVGIGTTAPSTQLEVAGALRLSTTSMDQYVTPQGNHVPTKINIPYFDPGAYGQIIAAGLPSSAASTARAMTFVDGRTVVHQPTVAVLTPDESNIMGLSFDGSNSAGFLKTTTGNLGFVVNNNTTAMFIDNTASVGIGTTTPGQALDVNGNIKTNGCLYYASSSLGTCASDERLKKDVKPFDLGLKALLGFNPVNFKYNGLGGFQDDGKTQLGVIAQDLEKAAPELIEKKMIQLHPDDKEKTEIKVVNYGAFTYVIINAFKEFYHKVAEHFDSQDRTIASIKLEAEQANNKAQKLEAENAVKDKEIESLKQENADIKARLERIEKMLH